MTASPPCPVCSGSTRLAFRHRVMGDREASYHLCDACEFICARPADWLAEAHGAALAITDTGAVARSEALAQLLVAFAWLSGLHRGRGLDVGGGTGLLVRMLRDRGLDVRWSDPHAENLLARGFEDDGGTYAWVAMAEVFEHLVEPYEFLRAVAERHRPRSIFFTTELRPALLPPTDWWYWSFETGQHVGFASIRSLRALASRLGYSLASSGARHLLSREQRDLRAFALASTRLAPALTALARRRLRSLTFSDHLRLAASLRARG